MHHFGINFPIHSVSLTSLVSIQLIIHLSTHLSHHPSLPHSSNPGSKPTFSTNPFHLRLLYLPDCLMITGLDRTYHAHHFIFSFTLSCIMWQSSLSACGHVGVATRAGGVLFVTRRDTCVRACRQYSQLSVINRQLQTCLNLSVY